MPRLLAGHLAERVRRSGGQPLLTYYDDRSGERTELSATTFANWVAKTVNLMDDELGCAPGDRLRLELARTDPGHWVTAVWQVACWHAGIAIDLAAGGEPLAVVCGPDWTSHHRLPAPVLACSLHPFATGLGDLPGSVLDYDTAVRAQPDSTAPVSASPGDLAWTDDRRRLSQADLAALPGSGERRLIVPGEPWPTAAAGIVSALVGGGSVVTVVGAEPDRLAAIGRAERVGS